MDVAGEEGGLEPAGERVDDDAERDEEAGGVDVDAGPAHHRVVVTAEAQL